MEVPCTRVHTPKGYKPVEHWHKNNFADKKNIGGLFNATQLEMGSMRLGVYHFGYVQNDENQTPSCMSFYLLAEVGQ